MLVYDFLDIRNTDPRPVPVGIHFSEAEGGNATLGLGKGNSMILYNKIIIY